MNQRFYEQREELLIHEWLIVLIFLGTLILLSFVTFCRADPMPVISTSPHYLINPKIDVYIQGAVKNPGMVTVERETTVAQVLVMADPLPDADLKKIKRSSKVRQGQIIKIPFQKPSRKNTTQKKKASKNSPS